MGKAGPRELWAGAIWSAGWVGPWKCPEQSQSEVGGRISLPPKQPERLQVVLMKDPFPQAPSTHSHLF